MNTSVLPKTSWVIPTFPPIPPERMKDIQIRYEETKEKASSFRSKSDKEILDAVFEEVSNHPTLFENAEAIRDLEKTLRYFKQVHLPEEMKKAKEEKKLSLKEAKYNFARSMRAKNVFSKNSRNPLKSLFQAFSKGCRYGLEKRQARIMKVHFKKAVLQNYRDKQKMLKQEKAALLDQYVTELLKGGNAEWTPNIRIPKFSPQYERNNKFERIAERSARVTMEKMRREYKAGKRPTPPLVKDYIELRDEKIKQLKREESESIKTARAKYEEDMRISAEKRAKQEEKLSKYLHRDEQIFNQKSTSQPYERTEQKASRKTHKR